MLRQLTHDVLNFMMTETILIVNVLSIVRIVLLARARYLN